MKLEKFAPKTMVFNCKLFVFVTLVHLLSSMKYNVEGYGKGFFNHTGCLYANLGGGRIKLNTDDGQVINEKLGVETLNYDSDKSECNSSTTEPSKLAFAFTNDKGIIKSVAIVMKIVPSISEGYWEIEQANMTFIRTINDVDKKRTMPLRVRNMYAGLQFSYSCQELKLHTVHKKKSENSTEKVEPKGTITLERFQLQPFPELKRHVFAASYDCTTWFTLPGIMGLILVLFMTTATVIGVNFLQKITTNDFKYNKEGQLFTQSQMDSMKHQQ